MQSNSNIIVSITGRPGMGKYTIAKALCENPKYKFILCDNHLINNPIFSLVRFHDNTTTVSQYAREHIEQIRSIVFDFITYDPISKTQNYVFTNNLYDIDKCYKSNKIYTSLSNMIHVNHSLFIPIQLNISQDEHLKRIQNPDRTKLYKGIDTKYVYDQTARINTQHTNLLSLNVTELSPQEAANKIVEHIEYVKNRPISLQDSQYNYDNAVQTNAVKTNFVSSVCNKIMQFFSDYSKN